MLSTPSRGPAVTHLREYLLVWSDGGCAAGSRTVCCDFDGAIAAASGLIDAGDAAWVTVADVEHQQVVYRYERGTGGGGGQ
ncbi:MAG: hypothetical protein ACRDT6_21420 [Micromonosporaceae bacterium]